MTHATTLSATCSNACFVCVVSSVHVHPVCAIFTVLSMVLYSAMCCTLQCAANRAMALLCVLCHHSPRWEPCPQMLCSRRSFVEHYLPVSHVHLDCTGGGGHRRVVQYIGVMRLYERAARGYMGRGLYAAVRGAMRGIVVSPCNVPMYPNM